MPTACNHPNCPQVQHLRELMEANDKARAIALEKFEAITSVKMEHLNDVRPQLASQKAEFIPRAEYDLNHKLLEAKIDALNRFMWWAIGALAAVEFILKFIK